MFGWGDRGRRNLLSFICKRRQLYAKMSLGSNLLLLLWGAVITRILLFQTGRQNVGHGLEEVESYGPGETDQNKFFSYSGKLCVSKRKVI